MTRIGPYRNGQVNVRAKQCDACLFTPDRIVPGSRVAQIYRDTTGPGHLGATFICHKDQTAGEPTSICKGWWDRFAMDDPLLVTAMNVGLVNMVDPQDKPTNRAREQR